MSMMTVDGYRAQIENDSDIDLFRGEILGLAGGPISMARRPRSSEPS